MIIENKKLYRSMSKELEKMTSYILNTMEH